MRGYRSHMTLPRSTLIDSEITPYYHCVSRCVRRAFLCGHDTLTGFDFEHRRAWIENRFHHLAEIFAIDLWAYAVMSNHYHLVLRLSLAQLDWSDDEVIRRWRCLHRLPEWFELADEKKRSETVAVWRERLGNISWFMKCVNEPLARWANKEDGCKGRFWEGRFKSQALLDDEAVLKCMAYVDLNPVRAKLANTPADSDHTSIQAHIEGRSGSLAPFFGDQGRGFPIPISKREYLELVHWTGRQMRDSKRGSIVQYTPPIVERLSRASLRGWRDEMSDLTRHYFRAIGNVVSLSKYRDGLGQTRLKGLRAT